MLILSAISAGAIPPAVEADRMVLQSVADHVVKHTCRKLVNHQTGQEYETSAGLKPQPEVGIASKFNAWYYQTWLLTDGMRRVARVLPGEDYVQYGEQNLDFLYRHMDYFQAQRDAGISAPPAGDGKLSPIGFYFSIQSLWQTGLAPLVEEQYASRHDPRYLPFLNRVDAFLARASRFPDGTFYRSGKGLMTDDVYMTVPYLVRKWKASGEEKYLREACHQVGGTYDRLFDLPAGLYRHLWDLKTSQPAGQFWGRGNGWVVLAQVELLEALPPGHPLRPEVLAHFEKHMAGLVRVQDPAGGWHQVLDHPESWVETSGTAMALYGLACGVNEGWLPRSYAAPARAGWQALKTKILADGDVLDVCASTDTGNLEYYLKRPRLQGDLHGFGSTLLAGAEMIRLIENKKE